MKKEGFTLIELLATIVILSIIAVIAVPIVKNVIDDTKKSSIEQSVKEYIHVIELTIASENINRETDYYNGEYIITSNGKTLSNDNVLLSVNYKGYTISDGIVSIENGQVKSISNLVIDDNCINYDGKNIIVVDNGLVEDVTLPKNYQQVEYIESTGQQYISLDYYVNNNSIIEVKFSAKKLILTGEMVIGSKSPTVSTAIFIAPVLAYQTFGAYKISRDANYWKNNIDYTVIIKNGEQIVNDNSTAMALNEDFESDHNLYLFARNNSGSAQYKANIKFYYIKIYEENELISNMVPCYDKTTNEIGIYDLIKQRFYSDEAKVGSFILGPNV